MTLSYYISDVVSSLIFLGLVSYGAYKAAKAYKGGDKNN